jgi:hypothetical protein
MLYEDACERVVHACSMLRKMQNRISYVPFAFVMLIIVLVLIGISRAQQINGLLGVLKKVLLPFFIFYSQQVI